MAVDIPIHGEELLSLGWEKADKGEVKLKGAFATRMVMSAKKHPDSKKYSPLINGFMKGWAEILYANNQLSIGQQGFKCKGASCSVAKNQWLLSSDEDHYFFDFKLSNGEFLRFDFSNLKEGSPRRLTVSPIGQTLETTPFQLDLFINNCE